MMSEAGAHAKMAPDTLSNDLRERAMARIAASKPVRQIAAALSISPSCVSKWS